MGRSTATRPAAQGTALLAVQDRGRRVAVRLQSHPCRLLKLVEDGFDLRVGRAVVRPRPARRGCSPTARSGSGCCRCGDLHGALALGGDRPRGPDARPRHGLPHRSDGDTPADAAFADGRHLIRIAAKHLGTGGSCGRALSTKPTCSRKASSSGPVSPSCACSADSATERGFSDESPCVQRFSAGVGTAPRDDHDSHAARSWHLRSPRPTPTGPDNRYHYSDF